MTNVEYLTCIFCSRNMLLKKVNAEELGILEKDPASEWFVYQVREARGRSKGVKGAGFYLIPDECKTIKEMLNDERLRPYALGVIRRLKLIIDSYTKAGLLEA